MSRPGMIVTNAGTESEFVVVKLAATYLHDHLEVWNEEEFGPAPFAWRVGKTHRSSILGVRINLTQLREIYDRAKMYADDPDDYRESCPAVWRNAKRVVAALEKRFTLPTLSERYM